MEFIVTTYDAGLAMHVGGAVQSTTQKMNVPDACIPDNLRRYIQDSTASQYGSIAIHPVAPPTARRKE